jgi:hypothetical protein
VPPSKNSDIPSTTPKTSSVVIVYFVNAFICILVGFSLPLASGLPRLKS